MSSLYQVVSNTNQAPDFLTWDTLVPNKENNITPTPSGSLAQSSDVLTEQTPPSAPPPPAENPEQLRKIVPISTDAQQQPVNDDNAVDLIELAQKTVGSVFLVFTNLLLSLEVGFVKLTGFTLIPLALAPLTKPLHELNASFAKEYGFEPMRNWAEAIDKENTRIADVDNVFYVKVVNGEGRPMFNLENYKKQAWDSFKAVVAPISGALIVISALVWLAVKPLWVAVGLPGWLADHAIPTPVLYLNKLVGQLTFAPLKDCAETMWNKHMAYLTYLEEG